MKLLEERIKKDGIIKEGNVLKSRQLFEPIRWILICSMRWEKEFKRRLQTNQSTKF